MRAIFIIALLIRLAAAYSYSAPLGGDEIAYNDLALQLVKENKFAVSEEYSHPPGYPFFISVIYFIFGCKPFAVRVIQAIFDSALCAMIYWLSCKLFGKKIGLIAALFSVCYLVFIKSAALMLTESIFTFILFLTVIFIYRSREGFSYSNAVITGLLIAILTLIKGVMLLFLPFLALSFIIARFYKGIGAKEFIKKITVLTVSFLLPMSIWVYRNYRVYNTFVPVSTQTGWAFYDSYFPRDGKIFGVNAFDENVLYALSFRSQTMMSGYLKDKAVEFIKNNPVKVLRLEFLKFLYFWCPFDWELMGVGNGVYNFQYVFMMPFAVFAMVWLLKYRDKYLFLYLPVVYLFLMSLLFYGSPRFRMPVEPYVIIFFAAGIFEFFKRYRNKFLPAVICLAYGTVNFFLYMNSAQFKLFLRDGLRGLGIW